MGNNPLDPHKNSSNEEEIANTPSDKGKKTDDGILGDLDFWQKRYSDKKTKYEQITLADAIETADEITEDFTEEYEQTSFEGFDIKPKPKRRKSKKEKDEIDFLLEDTQKLISHYDEDLIDVSEIEYENPDSEKEEHAEPKDNNAEQEILEGKTIGDETKDNSSKKAVIEETSSDGAKDDSLKEDVVEKTSSDKAKDDSSKEDVIEKTSSDEVKSDSLKEDAVEKTSSDKAKDDSSKEDVIEKTSSDKAKDDSSKEDVIEKTSSDEVKNDSLKENVVEKTSSDEAQKEDEEDQRKLTLISSPSDEQEQELKEEEIITKNKKSKQREKKQEKKNEAKIISEYTDRSQRDIILRGLKKSFSQVNTVKSALTVTFILSLIVAVIPYVFRALSLDIPSFYTVGNIVLTVINITLLAVSVCFAAQSFLVGLAGFKKGISAHTLSSISVILALIQAVSTIFVIGKSPIISYSYISVAIFSLLLNAMAEQKNIKRIITCFDFCAYTQCDALYAIRNINKKSDADSIGKDLNINDPKIIYSGRVDFATDFLKDCRFNNVSSSIVKRNLVLSLAMSLIIAGLAGHFHKDIFFILTVFTGTFCLTSPFTAFLSLASALLRANQSLSADGGVILSYPAAKGCAQADAVAVDCADLFCRPCCSMESIHASEDFRAYDVLLYSVAMILQSGGPLSEVFNSVINGQRDILPRVRLLKYTDKMGLSANIYKHSVLLGSKLMMEQNRIIMPVIDEEKYLKNGYKLLYMSIDSAFAAYFVVKYKEDKTLYDSINELVNKGIKLVMRTDDPNVTNKYVAKCFNIPENYVASTDSEGSDALRWNRNNLEDSAPAAVLHDGNPYSYFRSVVLCHRLKNISGNIKLFALLLTLLLCAGATAAVVLKSFIIFSPFIIIAVHVLALLFALLIQKIKI